MAPEVIDNTGLPVPYDHRVDIWSLGFDLCFRSFAGLVNALCAASLASSSPKCNRRSCVSSRRSRRLSSPSSTVDSVGRASDARVVSHSDAPAARLCDARVGVSRRMFKLQNAVLARAKQWSSDFNDFVAKCLVSLPFDHVPTSSPSVAQHKDPEARAPLDRLLKHSFLANQVAHCLSLSLFLSHFCFSASQKSALSSKLLRPALDAKRQIEARLDAGAVVSAVLGGESNANA